MLDLKFFVHHGEYVVQKVAGIVDLLGSDVTLIHRLAKNHVTESMGGMGTRYLAETYEHLGDVKTYIMDMHVRYDEMKR